MYKKVFLLTILLFMSTSQLCSATEPYYYWYHDYTEAPPNSLAVWNFNQPLGTIDLVAGYAMEISGWAGLSGDGRFGGSFYNVGGQFSEDYGQARYTTILNGLCHHNSSQSVEFCLFSLAYT